MKYVILMQVDPTVLEGRSEAEQQAIGDGHQKFMDEITRTGEMLSTNALGGPDQTRTIRGRT